jgi:UDP-N-acetylmuramate dehydrogenase
VPPPILKIQEQVLLAPYTTFRIGGPARFFCDIHTEAELLEAVEYARERNLAIFVLGGGSNLLISDRGFDGLVLYIALDTPAQARNTETFVDYTAAAGTDWDRFVHQICEHGISGIECLAGIPGTVGGTPVQNVGAYGQEVANTITHVRALDLSVDDLKTSAFVNLTHEQCRFAYRRSLFNTTHRNRYIVTQVTFRFDRTATPTLTYPDLQRHFANQAQPPTPIEIYHAVREIRHGKGMLIVDGEPDCRSAGSFFKNPIIPESTLALLGAQLKLPAEKIPHWAAGPGNVKLPAAWLLEQSGFRKGFTPYPESPAGISSRHTLALINRGHATAADITTLRNAIQHEIASRFHIQLEQEPVSVGL